MFKHVYKKQDMENVSRILKFEKLVSSKFVIVIVIA